MTFSRGRLVFENFEFVGTEGVGEFMPSVKRSCRVALRAAIERFGLLSPLPVVAFHVLF